jgi:hypothetical protein
MLSPNRAGPVPAIASQIAGFRSNNFRNHNDNREQIKGASRKMSTTSQPLQEPKKRLLSLDTWAVLLALAAALLVRSGVLTRVPW